MKIGQDTGNIADRYSDLLWNYGSIVFLALGGLLFSGIIMEFYDAAVLGVFNRIYAYYLILSQIAVFGVHMAVMKYTSDKWKEPDVCKVIFHTAAVAVTGLSAFVCIVAMAISMLLGLVVESQVLKNLPLTFPGLILFSINKVIQGYINGLSRMKAYAVLQSLRNLLISCCLICLGLIRVPGGMLVLCFTLAEAVLCIISITYLKVCNLTGGYVSVQWMRQEMRFGVAILPGNLILEANTKVDVICLGLLLKNDVLVGYYSFASLFVEGFYQLFVVLRRMVNPRLAQSYQDQMISEGIRVVKKHYGIWLRILQIPGLVVLVIGYTVVCFIMRKQEYLAALAPLILITACISLTGKSIVLGNILGQTGFPLQESKVNIAAVCSNIMLNVLLIPFFGLMGAAAATGSSYLVFSYVLTRYTKKQLAVSL